MKKSLICIVVLLTAVFSLSADGYQDSPEAIGISGPLYSWYNYQEMYYEYERDKTAQAIENLLQVYEKILKGQEYGRLTVPPGICADYGYVALLAGDYNKGRELLAMEVSLYPESATLVQNLLTRIPGTEAGQKTEEAADETN